MARNLGILGVAELALAAASNPRPALAQHFYNAVTDFTLTANPSAHWSYLADSTIFSNSSDACDGVQGFEAWDSGQGLPDQEEVAKNATGATFQIYTIIVPTDALVLDPESAAGTVVRFKVPITGSYSLKGEFQRLELDQAAHAVVILHNGAVMFGGPIATYGAKAPFKGSLTLAAGDTNDLFSNQPIHLRVSEQRPWGAVHRALIAG